MTKRRFIPTYSEGDTVPLTEEDVGLPPGTLDGAKEGRTSLVWDDDPVAMVMPKRENGVHP